MSWLERNLDLLARRQPELASYLREISSQAVEVFPSAAGPPTASYRKGDIVHSLHSRYNPLREARAIIQRTDLEGADYFVLLGFGLGYVLDALLEMTAHPDNRYFVVESNAAIFKAALDARDLRHMLLLPHLHLAWPAAGPDLARQWDAFFDPVGAQKNVFVSHPPSVAIAPGHFRSAAEVIQSQTLQIFTDINTLVGRSEQFLANFVQNLPRAKASPGVNSFKGRFEGIPAILVGAGPSLDKNIHELRFQHDRVLILSTDTATKPLVAAGIEPHFILTGDPSHENYLHLKDCGARGALLVAEATAYPASLVEFEGRRIVCMFENSSLRSLSELLGSKGTLRAWGSVATMALDFAILLGCNPIIFVGQDLAHSDGRIYCSGLYFEEKWFEGVADPETWELRMKQLRQGKKTLMLRDIFDRPVETTDKLVAYWNWITKEIGNHPEVRFVNATEGGILKDQVEIISLREALYRYCGENLRLRQRVNSSFAEALEREEAQAGLDIAIIRAESEALARILKQGSDLCGERRNSDPRAALEGVVRAIYSNRHLAPLVDSFNQMANITFLRKKAALGRRAGKDTTNEVREVYREYFEGIRQSLQKIDTALSQISKSAG